ncbi:MAG: hypothetical protein ABW217_02385 [Polyangiaceae bacterium]
MRLRQASSERLSFEGRRPAQAALMLVPAVSVLCVVPWLAPGPPTPERLFMSLALALVVLGLLRLGWARRERIELLPGSRQIVAGGSVRPFAGAPSWSLEVYPEPLERQGCRYAAVLALGDERWSLLQGTAPERVLTDLARVLAAWSVPVVGGWGLPEHVRPWKFEPERTPRSGSTLAERAASAGETQLFRGPRFGSVMGLAGLLVLITITVAADMVFLVSTGAVGLANVHPLSIALPSLMVFGLVCLTVWIASARSVINVGHRVVLGTTSLLFNSTRGSVRAEVVRGVHVIGAEQSSHRHLLIESDEGPLALLVRAEDARALAQRLSHTIGAERSTPRPSYAAALPELGPRENSVSR